MKKSLLFGLLAVPLFSLSQVIKDAPTVKGIESMNAVSKPIFAQADVPQQWPTSSIKASGRELNKKAPFEYITVGETYYDLQTNASIGRRIVLHPNGKVSAVWTTSPTTSNGEFPTRGSGYNHFNGTSWLPTQSAPIEGGTRTGWPSIGVTSDGKEFVLGHEANLGGFYLSKNTAIGSQSWTLSPNILDDQTDPLENRAPIWGRAAAGNGYIHVLANYTPSGNNATVVRAGVSVPTTYSRLSSNGDVVDISNGLLPMYDSTLYASGGGDNYAIDVRDSIVAIVMGGLGDPVSMWKSTNNGDSFTYFDVDNYAYKGKNNAAQLMMAMDTAITSDGSVEILIDNDGKVHVFYSTSRVIGRLGDATGDTIIAFYPGAMNQIIHWVEGSTELQLAGTNVDLDSNGALAINPETFNALGANGVLPNGVQSAARTGTTSLTTMPSASIDADGNMFLVYSAAIEAVAGLVSPHIYNANHRDILITYSTDGGLTWMGPQTLTRDYTLENNFPCISKVTDDNIHVIFQQDDFPGTSLQNNNDGGYTHPNGLNKIQYVTVPKSEILNNEIGILSTNEVKAKKVFVIGQNAPNPFNETSEVTIYLKAASNLTVTVTDVLGNVLSTENLGVKGTGNHNITLNGRDLASGMYFYTISTEEFSVTKRMQVSK